MNTARLIEFFSHKGWSWRRIFCNFFLLKHNLYGIDCKTDFDPEMFVRFCRNVDDLEEMWNLAEYIDLHEDELTDIIGNYRFLRSIPWQYDFVETVATESGLIIPQTLDLYAITDACCIALYSDKVDWASIVNRLDGYYEQLYAVAAKKQTLLKRNLSLVLETLDRRHVYKDASDLNFRELLTTYLPICGFEAVIQAVRRARTAEIKLTKEEKATLAFAYYSPYFADEEELQRGLAPSGCIFSCVEECLQEAQEYRQYLQDSLLEADDEDSREYFSDALEETHNAVYLDPQEKCLIDIRYGKFTYANVYIEQTPEDFLNNSLPDFIRYHKGCLYTVEFVEDIKQLDVAQELLEQLNDINREMLRLERKHALTDGEWSDAEQQKYEELDAERTTCYYVCD